MSNKRAFSSIITGLLVLGLLVQVQETLGSPAVDYQNYDAIPKTSFSCSEQKYIPGFYADMETECQVFHFCEEDLQESFQCPSGTRFNQASLTCDSWDNSNCSLTPLFYSVNAGPEMESARRNVLMVLQLRNKSRSRQSVHPSANVYEKITSLYDNTVGEAQSKSPDLSVDTNAESNDKISHEASSQETQENEERVSQYMKDFFGLDEGIQNDFPNVYSTDDSEGQGSEEMEPDIFYDPVTEKYYVDYDSSEAVNRNLEGAVNPFDSFYNYGTFGKRYGLALNEYEMQRDSENDDSKERVNVFGGFDKRFGTAEESEEELLKRLLDPERPAKRVRRKPLYTVVQEDDELRISGAERGVKYPISDSANKQYKTESVLTDTEVNFEFPQDISERDEVQEKADSEVPVEIADKSQNSNIASLGNFEVPQTSEEFEQAIISELVPPEINEHGLSRSLPSEEEQRDEESLENVYQTGGQYSFIENATPADYEYYSTDYNDDTEIKESMSDTETSDYEESSNWYRDEESFPSSDSKESDDTYVVIPDEYDARILEQYTETNERSEAFGVPSDVAYSHDAWRHYVSPEVYTPMGPYWFPVSGYHYPSGYETHEPFISEDFLNPDLPRSSEYDDSGAPNDQAYRYEFADMPQDRYFSLSDAGSYAYEQSSGYPGHVYDYATEGRYPYANVYGNPYVGNLGYDISEVNDAASSNLNETPVGEITVNSDYFEPGIQPWVQGPSTESSEDVQMEATQSSVPTEEALADMYITSGTDGDLAAMPDETLDVTFDNEDMKQSETFYLFDFDEGNEEQFKLDGTDTDQLGSRELFQNEEPMRANESEDSKGTNFGSESESTEILTSTGLGQENVNFHSSETDVSEKTETTENQTEESLLNDDPVARSEVGNMAALDTASTQSPRQPRSYPSNINLPRDPTLFSDKMYPESNFQLQDVVMDQQYGTGGIPITSSTENGLFPRTGDAGLSRISKLSEIQERIRSLKQGKFGTLKKYISSAGSKN